MTPLAAQSAAALVAAADPLPTEGTKALSVPQSAVALEAPALFISAWRRLEDALSTEARTWFRMGAFHILRALHKLKPPLKYIVELSTISLVQIYFSMPCDAPPLRHALNAQERQ